MKTVYQTEGTCCRQIELEVDGDVVKSVRFLGGCHGNLQGIARLVEGMNVADVVSRLSGIRCGMKPTSCPDQLSLALRQAGSRLGRTKTSAARRRSVFQKRRSCRFGSVPVGDLGGNLFCRENAVCMSGI